MAEVSPDLVSHNAKGELSTVRDEAVNAMLLNELCKVQKLGAALEKINARLKEQDAKIQTVSEQIEPGKALSTMASNDQ